MGISDFSIVDRVGGIDPKLAVIHLRSGVYATHRSMAILKQFIVTFIG